MKKNKDLLFAIGIALLSILHLVLSIYYWKLYGYFNLHDNLTGFLLAIKVFRLGIYLLICGLGYQSLRHQEKKLLACYGLLFLFNLILPFIF